MRVLFLGTGTFGEPAFRAIAGSPHNLVGLVTQPDRSGKGKHRSAPAMKAAAEQLGVPMFQPPKVNAEDSLDRLRAFDAEAFVVAAYGQILSKRLLAIPPLGAFNLHGSVLPKYRGAAPVHAAVRAGEGESGVTLFRIVKALDAGPVAATVRTPIGPRETAGELHDRLADLAAAPTLGLLDSLAAGTLALSEQDHAAATYAPQMDKAEGRIDWGRSAVEIDRHVRGTTPWPGAFSLFEPWTGRPVRCVFTAVEPVEGDGGEPGEATDRAGELVVACGEGAVRVDAITPSGKRPMGGAAFLNGRGAGRFG